MAKSNAQHGKRGRSMIENFWLTQDLNKKFPQSQTLGEIINALTAWNQMQGRVVCSVSVNGIKLKEEEERKFSQVKLAEIQEIRVESETPENLLEESLMGCREYIEKLIFAFEKISELILAKDYSYALHYQEIALEAFQAFYELATHFSIVYGSCRGGLSQEWEEAEAQTPHILSQIIEGYEKKDYQLVADLLEYEMLTVLEKWKSEIYKLGQSTVESTVEPALSI